jgi:hypothetical protein
MKGEVSVNADAASRSTGIRSFSARAGVLYIVKAVLERINLTKEELLAFIDKGHAWRQQFVVECLKDPDRCEKPLTRSVVKNFASTGVTSRIRGKPKFLSIC